MPMWRKGVLLSATFLIGLFVAVGCKKKEQILGQDSIDPNDLLTSEGVDTFTLRTFTIEEDSVITDNPAYGILGQFNDPDFGQMNSEIYTQIRLAGVDPNFQENPFSGGNPFSGFGGFGGFQQGEAVAQAT